MRDGIYYFFDGLIGFKFGFKEMIFRLIKFCKVKFVGKVEKGHPWK